MANKFYDMSPLTTLTPNDIVWENKNLNDADPVSLQNNRSVECRLKETYRRIAVTEANVFLFTTLKNLNLATNDVANFVKKQTIHKRVNSRPDLKVQKTAMQSKLADSLVYASRLRRQRDSLKKKLSSKFGASGKSRCRRILDGLNRYYKKFKETEIQDAKKKVDHYLNRQKAQKCLKVAPPWN